MKKKELKLIIGLMTQEILEQKAAARHYRQERDMKAMELRKAQQELRGGNDRSCLMPLQSNRGWHS